MVRIRNLVKFFLPTLILAILACENKQPSDITSWPNTGVTEGDAFKVDRLEHLVFYEINLRAFGPGCNLIEVQNQLDSIQALGVNVIWLMPIFPIGEEKRVGALGSPYSVRDYTDVNPEFGTLNDLKNLVSAAHKKNIAVILDWVANHTAWDNPWIANSDWYTQDANGNIMSPPGTNWTDVADLNYNNAQMRLEMINAMKFWVKQAGIDGFRCDAADFVPYNFWCQAIDSLNKMGKTLILLAEGSRTDHYTAGFQLTYAWDFYDKMNEIFGKSVDASSIFSVHNAEYGSVPPGKHKLRYITNHDEYAWNTSVVRQYGNKKGSVAAFVIMALMSNVPLIYAGQEIAEPNTIPFFSVYPLDWNKNIDIKYQYQQIMQIRKKFHPANRSLIPLPDHEHVVAFKLVHPESVRDSSLLVLVNCRNFPVNYDLDNHVPDSVKDMLTGDKINLSSSIHLESFEYKLFNY